MDDLIADAQDKRLIEFGTVKPFIILMHLFMGLKDMSKIPQIELNIYWNDYIIQHGDYVGFIY
jgi:hypothetical protein